MALSAGRFDVARRQERLLPGQGAVVGFLDRSGNSLPAVAHRTAELIEVVRNRRVFAKWLHGNISQAGFLQANVAGSAAVDNSEFGMPDLLNSALKMPLQGDGIAARANHVQIGVLIVPPFAEMMFGGRDREREQKHHADGSKYANRVFGKLLENR